MKAAKGDVNHPAHLCITVIVTALVTKKDLCKGGIPRHL
ncbi:HokD family protein [Escherichia coli 99.0741]|nr:HokD family protein [Escherichia coli 99.0741]